MNNSTVMFRDENLELVIAKDDYEVVERTKDGEKTGVQAVKAGYTMNATQLATAIEEGTARRVQRPDGEVAYVVKASVIVETRTARELDEQAAAKAGRALVSAVKKGLGVTKSDKPLKAGEKCELADVKAFVNAANDPDGEGVRMLFGRSSSKVARETIAKLADVIHGIEGKGTTGKGKQTPDEWRADQQQKLINDIQLGVVMAADIAQLSEAIKNGYLKRIAEEEKAKLAAAEKRSAAKLKKAEQGA